MRAVLEALYRDLWVPVWPNLAASLVWGPVLVHFHNRSIKRHSQHLPESFLDRVLEAVGLEEDYDDGPAHS